MGRKAHFSTDEFLEAALRVLTARGPGAVTVSAVAAEAGAPVGSVYHRFASKDQILGELWLATAESFQAGFFEALGQGGLEAALFTPRWARRHPNKAKMLLLYRREELISRKWPERCRRRARRLAERLGDELRGFAERTQGRQAQGHFENVLFALVDVPLASVKRHLEAGRAPPAAVDERVGRTFAAILGGAQNENPKPSRKALSGAARRGRAGHRRPVGRT